MLGTRSTVMLLLAATVLTASIAKRRGDADALIAARQAAFKLSGATFGSMKAAVDAGGDVKKLAFGAHALAEWAHAMPGLFPLGSDGGSTKALPRVWAEPEGFAKAARLYEAEATKLAAISQTGDQPGFAAQWSVVRGTCKACHDIYHEPEAPKK